MLANGAYGEYSTIYATTYLITNASLTSLSGLFYYAESCAGRSCPGFPFWNVPSPTVRRMDGRIWTNGCCSYGDHPFIFTVPDGEPVSSPPRVKRHADKMIACRFEPKT